MSGTTGGARWALAMISVLLFALAACIWRC